MSLEHAQLDTAASPQPNGQTNTRLYGRGLVLARVAWVVVFVLAVGLFSASIPFTFNDAHTLCTAADCSHNSYLTPRLAYELQQLGLSINFYAILITTWSIILEAVYVATGVVIFWRRSDDPMALLSSLALITFGAAFRGFNPEAALSPFLYVMSFIMAFLGNSFFGLFIGCFNLRREANPLATWRSCRGSD